MSLQEEESVTSDGRARFIDTSGDERRVEKKVKIIQ